jgi:hypothetical protein
MLIEHMLKSGVWGSAVTDFYIQLKGREHLLLTQVNLLRRQIPHCSHSILAVTDQKQKLMWA